MLNVSIRKEPAGTPSLQLADRNDRVQLLAGGQRAASRSGSTTTDSQRQSAHS
jgi:hypothetical protein